MSQETDDGTGHPTKPGFVLRRFLRLVGSAASVTGRTLPGQLGLFVLFAYLFLWVPDLDLAALPLLHHRSILTHSLLPGLFLLAFGRRLGAGPLAGGLVGLSVHLTCDMLSPMTGFAQIWLPAPIKAPIGPLSYLWLAANAVVGFATASLVARLAFPKRFALPVVALGSIVTGITYGAVNEGSAISVIIVLVAVLLSLWPESYLRRRAKQISEIPSN